MTKDHVNSLYCFGSLLDSFDQEPKRMFTMLGPEVFSGLSMTLGETFLAQAV